jgi:hypothetical protein
LVLFNTSLKSQSRKLKVLSVENEYRNKDAGKEGPSKVGSGCSIAAELLMAKGFGYFLPIAKVPRRRPRLNAQVGNIKIE